ncbi:MAG: TRL-like family protein [Bdellovibrionota bacterium]
MSKRMTRILAGISVFGALLGTAGCAYPMFHPYGWAFQDVTTGVAVTSNQAGNRVGEACTNSIAGAIAWGDASIEAARRNGGITMISSVDEERLGVMAMYSRMCTIVRGR